MSTPSHKFFLLTGEPGVGKTTLTKKICSILKEMGVKTAGFYTEEVKTNGVREGFDVVTFVGKRGRLARDQSLLPSPVNFKVGKYGVLVQEFEEVGLEALNQPEADTLLVVDEIGKMEFYSIPFKERVKDIFSSCKNIVFATIPLRKVDPLIEIIRNDKLSKLWMVTRENRNKLHQEIVQQIINNCFLQTLSGKTPG